MKHDDLYKLLHGYSYNFNSEVELQNGIESILTTNSVPFSREVRLTKKDRIDFLVDSIGIEVKIDGTATSLTRQLYRYAQHDLIDSLIVVTNKSKFTNLPNTINNKQIFLLYLLGNCF